MPPEPEDVGEDAPVVDPFDEEDCVKALEVDALLFPVPLVVELDVDNELAVAVGSAVDVGDAVEDTVRDSTAEIDPTPETVLVAVALLKPEDDPVAEAEPCVAVADPVCTALLVADDVSDSSAVREADDKDDALADAELLAEDIVVDDAELLGIDDADSKLLAVGRPELVGDDDGEPLELPEPKAEVVPEAVLEAVEKGEEVAEAAPEREPNEDALAAAEAEGD